MKTITKLALIGIATASLITGSALANSSEWATFQSGNATVTYRRPAQKEATVALSANRKGIERAMAKTKDSASRFETFPTAHGAASYFAPAE
jgi:hypothetical protein